MNLKAMELLRKAQAWFTQHDRLTCEFRAVNSCDLCDLLNEIEALLAQSNAAPQGHSAAEGPQGDTSALASAAPDSGEGEPEEPDFKEAQDFPRSAFVVNRAQYNALRSAYLSLREREGMMMSPHDYLDLPKPGFEPTTYRELLEWGGGDVASFCEGWNAALSAAPPASPAGRKE